MTRFRPICMVTDPRYLKHDTGGVAHPESPARLRAIAEKLKNGPLAAVLSVVAPRRAERGWITACHSEDYLFRLEEAALSGRAFVDHPDNQICFDSFDIAQLAAGAGPVGIDRLEDGHDKLVFCSVRPPGHHAEPALALGFCLLNNVGIAARYWQSRYGRKKIAIIDWDAHHGNGIQTLFEEDPDILYISIHEHPTFSFPGTGYAEECGIGRGAGTLLNIPLPPGADDELVLRAMTHQIMPAMDRFQPEALIVAAGFDGHALDDMSGLSYSTALYGQLGIHMAAMARKHCQGRLLSILEGGYHLEALAASVEQYCCPTVTQGRNIMYVTSHMTTPALTIPPGTLLAEARQLLQEHHFRHLPVVDDEGHLMGMVTDRDLRSALPSSVLADEEDSKRATQLGETTVREIMSHPHYFLTSISTLDDALYLFDKTNVGALPVIASDNRVTGILAIKNLLSAYKKLFGLGERGSALVAVEDDSKPKPLTRLVRVLENHEIRFTRLIRTDQEADGRPRTIYLRVHTFNMTAVHQALREAGFRLALPTHKNPPDPTDPTDASPAPHHS
ncbi:MAG: hypothetical protein AUK28_07145 [Desulfobacterales bacterium CG2_30_60_27]|nr:MAG: hypothetical protein AUK28_07145 [Desulfobacterales bacterium CG2_30_60_27]